MPQRPVRKLALFKTTKVTPPSQGGARRRVQARGIIQVHSKGAGNYIGELTAKRDVSASIPDPFEDFYGFGNGNNILLVPPYNFDQLTRVGEANSTLNQCIDSYIVNIESYPFVLEYVGPPENEKSADALKQYNRAMALMESPSVENNLRDIREKTRKDTEYTGNKYFEIMTNRAGEVTGFDHLPSTTMRLTRVDGAPTPCKVWALDPEDNSRFIQKDALRYFRRYVQLSATGRRVYFKEWGDPRSIDPATGKVNDALPFEEQATAVYHKPIYTPGCPYGIPRWIGALPVILGQRESELVNLAFFKENAIPAMAVLISGGALTEESFNNITSIIKAKRGKDAMNRILVLEAASDESAGSDRWCGPRPQDRHEAFGFRASERRNLQGI
jgi:PBSX family phage portal protein